MLYSSGCITVMLSYIDICLKNLAGLVTRLFRSGGRTQTAWEETHGGGGVVAW